MPWYLPELNVWIAIDETYDNPKHLQKDIQRQKKRGRNVMILTSEDVYSGKSVEELLETKNIPYNKKKIH